MVLYKICRELAFVCYIEFFAITRYVITRVECTSKNIQHYCTDLRKRARNSAPIIVSKLFGPTSGRLADSSSLERIIGTELRALFLWSVH